MKIVVGGQVEKKAIEQMIKDFDPLIVTTVKSDVEAAMSLKTGQADYYLGACHTGGGGALAMAIAIVGRDQCETVSMPGRQPKKEKITQAVNDDKKASGFPGDHAEQTVPMILQAIKNKQK